MISQYQKKNVLRGFHGDKKTWKLVSCIFGKFDLYIVNNNMKSKEYLKYIKIPLSDKKYQQVLIPPNFGNAHLVKSEKSIFHYKQTTYYDRKSQFTIKWNDKRLNIKWGIKKTYII
jgi:dTDP-4-dehydrorhamnose 3,5-epimerase